MINGANQVERTDEVFRLVALQRGSIQTALIARGIEPTSIDATIEAVVAVGVPLDVVDAVNFSFRPKAATPEYSTGRFGDGTYAVFYSAMDANTALEEVRYHRREELTALQNGSMPFMRYFTLIKCEFHGVSMILLGQEANYPDLVSRTEAGYPFCQAVARWAHEQGAQALHTASARRAGGTCVPVFERDCLSDLAILQRYRFSASNGGVVADKLPLDQR